MDSKPNILWVTLDSIRSDRTTMAGYKRDTTPNMARIAAGEKGTALTDCISHAMWSLPSDASMLTGMHPIQHGTGLWNEVLPEDIPTIPEIFTQLGYHTAGLSHNAYFTEATGLSRGFDRFEWVDKSNLISTVGPRILLKYILRLRRESAGYTASPDRHRSDYLSTELITQWLDTFAGRREPFFMFAHMLGAHVPYVPPLPYQNEFTDQLELSPSEAVETAYDLSINHYREIAGGCDFDPEEKGAVDAAYDGLVRYVDQKIGDLFDSIQSLNLGPTVVVVTADHGDLLGEKGIIGHQFSLHDGLINVPMVVHGLPSLADVPEDTLVQHADVMRALLLEAGADTESLAGIEGIDPRTASREFALSQRGPDTYQTAVREVRKHDPDFPAEQFHPGVLHAVRSSRYKFIQSDHGESLYALPDETTDRSKEYPDAVQSHRSFLEDVLGRLDRRTTVLNRELDDAMREQLSDLGYVVD